MHSFPRALTLAFAATTAVLCSCGFMTPAEQYAGPHKPTSEIAVIEGYQGSLFGGEYHATIAAFASQPATGAPVVRRFGLPGFTDYPHEIRLEPGDYALEVYCFGSLTQPSFRPRVDVSVQAGVAYTLRCVPADGQAAVVVSAATRLP